MKLFKKHVVEQEMDKELTRVKYYMFPEPCYRCGQLIINGITSSSIKEKSWDLLSGTSDVSMRNSTPEIVDGYSIYHYEHFYIEYPNAHKTFYHHWKCPTEKIEIPKDILERAEKKVMSK